MKILHTSDWHLGHTLYNYDRTEEQVAMLEQMVEIVREEQPDVFLLCGDVFHTSQPSAAVQTLFTNALVEIHDANPTMTIVITAGNHDSGTRHEIFRTPWMALKVHMIGRGPTRNEEPSATWEEEYIIEVAGKGYIVAVPYANERNIPEGFFQQLLDAVAARNQEGLPVVMMAHTTIKGCDFKGHDPLLRPGATQDDEFMVGGIDALDIKQMGEGYDYLALGHIHHEQFVHTDMANGHHRVRYSGTPQAVSFDENYAHSVSIVEIERHGEQPKVQKIEVANPRPLVTLPTEGLATWDEAKTLLAAFPNDIPAYIRLNVEIEDFLPVEANAEATTLTEGKLCRFCHINARRKAVQRAETKVLTVQEFQSEAPMDIARRYAEDLGITFDEEMIDLFDEVLEMIEEDLHND